MLTSKAAIEIDSFILEIPYSLDSLEELGIVLEKYQLKDSRDYLPDPNFPYIRLCNAITRGSDKDITTFQELALEMRLLRSELCNISSRPTSLVDLRTTLCNLSAEFRADSQTKRYGLAA